MARLAIAIALVLLFCLSSRAETAASHAARLARSVAFYHSENPGRAEGIGYGQTPAAARRNCCFTGQMIPRSVAVRRSASGGFVAVKRY